MLSNTAYFTCETAASQIIDDHNVLKASVPIFDIVKAMGLQLLEFNLGEETSGVLVIENGKGSIGYNPKDSFVRRRFTVAHELGHYILHRDANELFVDNFFLMKFRKNNSYTKEEYWQEQQANAFAAALLMPEKFIEAEIVREEYHGVDETELITKLARKFEVSIPGMSYRLTNLNIFRQGY
jgi:Zn-dependent peptidase ImmA (M78 family)